MTVAACLRKPTAHGWHSNARLMLGMQRKIQQGTVGEKKKKNTTKKNFVGGLSVTDAREMKIEVNGLRFPLAFA